MPGISPEAWVIFEEEIRRRLRSGGYIVFTLAGALLFVAAMFVVPIIVTAIQDDAPSFEAESLEEASKDSDAERTGFVDESGIFGSLEEYGPVRRYATTADGLDAKVAGDIDTLYVIPTDYFESGMVAQYWEPSGRFAGNWSAENAFSGLLTGYLLDTADVDPDLVTRAVAPARFQNFHVDETGAASEGKPVAQSVGELVTPMVFSILLLLSLGASTGAMVMSIAEEKENRLIELVVTAASPLSIMGGKLAALGVVGLTQAAVWIVVA